MEKWKTKGRFPTFPQPLATMIPVLFLKPKTKERKSVATRPPHSRIPLFLRSSGTDFMLIVRLENAQNVIRPTNWMLRGNETVPFQVPKCALEGSLLNGMQSPNAWPSQVK